MTTKTKTKKTKTKVTKAKKPDYKIADLVKVTEALNQLLDTYSYDDFTDMGQALLDVANTVPQNRNKWAHKKIHHAELVLLELAQMSLLRQGVGCVCKSWED